VNIICLGDQIWNLEYMILADRIADPEGSPRVRAVLEDGQVREVSGEFAARLLRRLEKLDRDPEDVAVNLSGVTLAAIEPEADPETLAGS
jgi:hypothetical protein